MIDLISQVIYTKAALKSLKNMDTASRERIISAINKNLSVAPFAGDVKDLKGQDSIYRLRVGGWRILFEGNKDGVIVNQILPRGQAYK